MVFRHIDDVPLHAQHIKEVDNVLWRGSAESEDALAVIADDHEGLKVRCVDQAL